MKKLRWLFNGINFIITLFCCCFYISIETVRSWEHIQILTIITHHRRHYRSVPFYDSSVLFPNLGFMKATYYGFLVYNIHFNITLPSISKLFKLTPIAFSSKTPYQYHITPTRATCPIYFNFFVLAVLTTVREESEIHSSSMWSFLQLFVTYSLLVSNTEF